ncbi:MULTISPECIES: CYTH domain-containing protein [unclassified Luteibacter]|uniref:CYTH domain-containing protein n=1 Tax=unclassified Luteibacter TaxID=2620188 RepID=UPI0008B70A9F|nr:MULTISPECIES: CYTH domain-containing protein [unclassified Luteibacter]MDR6935429.1 adenylate cyclase [Luteibacter sp. 3190]SEV95474.1 adenylate cyclase [Luteibacter sp. 329MFSha]
MGVEIERKFLLAGDGWRALVERSERMAQGYLVGAAAIAGGMAKASVRVRLADGHAWLNIKSATLGIERHEFEYPVPPDDAEQLLRELCDGVVEKVRHHVMIEGAHFEIDEFLGENAGLVVAEVELPSVDARFPRPAWLGAEVSEQARYYNVNLIDRPFAAWSIAEREGKGDTAC